MGSFFSKHQYLVIWISGLLIVGAIAILILQLNGSFLPTTVSLNQPTVGSSVGTPPAPPAPSVSLAIEKNGKQNSLLVQWQNLPGGTTALNIFRGTGASTSTWTLWKTISIGFNQLNGSEQFTLSQGDLNYDYYVQAVNGGGGDDNGSSTQVLWTSGPTEPSTSTSTDTGGGGNNNGNNGNNGNNNGNSTSSNQQNNNSSTQSNDNNNSSTNTSSTGGGGNNNSSTNGNAYYNPQIQVTGYGTANGSFWVEHVNQSIEVGWQNLPANTDDIILYRSQDQAGPWNQLLEQESPGSTGSYSLQLVDGTLNDPYYYEMIASQGTASSATYGPIYLPPNGQ